MDNYLTRAGLDGDDWASLCAQSIYEIVTDFQNGSLAQQDLYPGITCPIERYAETRGGKDGAGILFLGLLSAAGAVTQSGTWVAWEGKPGNRQTSPLVLHCYGLAQSGAGKSEQIKKIADVVLPAFARGGDALISGTMLWASQARSRIEEVFAALAEKYSGSPDAAKEFSRAKASALRTVAGMAAKLGDVLDIFKDSTAESLIADSIAGGGVGYIFSAEQDSLDNLARYSVAGGLGGSVSVFTEGWDGAEYSRSRRGTGILKTSSLCLSVTLLTQTASFAEGLGRSPHWMAKGMLGRGWVCGFPELDADDIFTQAVQSVEHTDGLVDTLREAYSRIAEENASTRVSRLIENNMGQIIAKLGEDPSELSTAVMGAVRQFSPAITSQMIRYFGRELASGEGRVRWIGKDDAVRLERLFTWLKASGTQGGWLASSEDNLLWPLLSRLTHHISRIAAVRELVLQACGPDDQWAVFKDKNPDVSTDLLADTAVRIVPWLVRMHLLTLGGVANVATSEVLRRDLIQAGGKDVSFIGQIAAAVKASGLDKKLKTVSGMSVSEIARLVSGRMAAQSDKTVHQMRAAIIAALRRDAYEGGGGYFTYMKGHKHGSVTVIGFSQESRVAEGPNYGTLKAGGTATLGAFEL